MSLAERSSFAKRFGVTLLAGTPGILALCGYIYLTTPPTAIPAGLSLPLFAVSAAVNSLLLLAVACLVGTYAAPRVELPSYLVDWARTGDDVWRRLRPEVRLAVGLGVTGGLLILLLDVALAPFVAQDLPQSAIGATDATVVSVLAYAPVRFLYGGITEELLLRYGLLSALAFIGWVLTGRRSGGPGSGVMWVAIVISAVLFGIGHLPALAQSIDLTPALVARTILLNAIAGVVFGWLYWQRSLEAAMVAHATFHVPLVALSLVQVALL
ncbi:CPBP family intramembrane glutamic endopeptidase [Halorubrum sp. AD140]|uniref:CPBP family intramembrane glutamic endopeptidase n=1 Tax=Halorubrum sp. AD140 TaxID=3050073 RepID=UPI002ACC908A|nr:CPBP family intramembrane glutamic endopeptidase [Halorubrum sp. AD140]MDZ5811930.1 CPBP family intramembrane glutamic endopeptidase [Halorubrum sp. AD140]